MGKYSQWLYHREIDQQLRERLQCIEQELHSLQEQSALLQDATPSTDNSILQAIAMQQSAEVLLEDTPSPSSSPFQYSPVHAKEQTLKSISSALFAWSNLPNLDTRNSIPPSGQGPDEAVQHTSITHSDIHLLPTDMAAFLEADDQTLPQLQVPNWLRKTQLSTNTTDRPRSEPDERTDISIQRWLERWGKQVPNSPQEQQTPQEGSEK